MKIKMDLGFEEFEKLKKKVEKMKIPLPVDLDYLRKYEKDWKTAYVPKEGPFTIKSVDNIILASLYPQFKGHPETWTMRSGKWFSPLKEGKEYIFGREPSFNLLQDLYYISIKPDEWDKRITGVKVPCNVSRVHCYVGNLNDEIQIARLGITPVKIEFYDDSGSNVWL